MTKTSNSSSPVKPAEDLYLTAVPRYFFPLQWAAVPSFANVMKLSPGTISTVPCSGAFVVWTSMALRSQTEQSALAPVKNPTMRDFPLGTNRGASLFTSPSLLQSSVSVSDTWADAEDKSSPTAHAVSRNLLILTLPLITLMAAS